MEKLLYSLLRPKIVQWITERGLNIPAKRSPELQSKIDAFSRKAGISAHGLDIVMGFLTDLIVSEMDKRFGYIDRIQSRIEQGK